MSPKCCTPWLAAGIVGVVIASFAIAQQSKEARPDAPAAQPDIPLPPGWTAEDMQACIDAGTPGEEQARLKKFVGVWRGPCQMWTGGEGTEPMTADCTWTVTSVMDGRYIRSEMAGDLPGMGPFQGFGYTGFDNVSGKYVGTWLDNHSTGIMNGTAKMSPDGTALSWKYTYNCPINRKPAFIRETHTLTGPDTMVMEAFVSDPKSGKESKCMRVEFERTK